MKKEELLNVFQNLCEDYIEYEDDKTKEKIRNKMFVILLDLKKSDGNKEKAGV